MLDEALQYALDFCRNDLNPEQMIKQGEVVLTSLSDRMREVDDVSGMTGFIIGGTLKKLKEGQAWKKLPGHKEWWQFKDFCKERLGKEQSWAYARIRVWEKSHKFGMTPEEVQELGWTVADEILRNAESPSDVVLMVQKFRDSETKAEFLSQIREKEIAKPITLQKKKKVILKIGETEKDFLEESMNVAAMKVGKELYRDMTPEEALTVIVTDWRQLISQT